MNSKKKNMGDWLWDRELRRREEELQIFKPEMIKENWLNTLLKTRKDKKKDLTEIKNKVFPVVSKLINFHNIKLPKRIQGRKRLLRLIFEVGLDLKASILLAETGFYKQANSQLRSALESSFRFVYFKQHPKSFISKYGISGDYFTLKKDKIKDVKFKNSSFSNKIFNEQEKLSKYIHSAPTHLTTKIAFAVYFDEEQYKGWSNNIKRVTKLILNILDGVI